MSDNKAKSRNAYYSLGQWNLIATEKTYAMVTKDLVEWVDNTPDVLCFEEFLISKKMSQNVFAEWCKVHPPLEEAYRHVLMTLGIRREKGAIKKEYDTSMISLMMPHYSSRWKEQVEWRSDMKRKEAEKSGGSIVAVMIPQVENSPMVPVKKVEEREE